MDFLVGRLVDKALEEAQARKEIPLMVVATAGSTSSCAFDHLEDIAAICARYKCWMHVDAACECVL
jgi:glutamate/tyrosine decarboxylase-like PLP-dependent enzyme